MARPLAHITLVLSAAAAGSGGDSPPDRPPVWADRRFPMQVTTHLGRLDSGCSGTSTGPFEPPLRTLVVLRIGGSMGLAGGPTVEVLYSFLGTAPAGDRYRLTRTVIPAGGSPEVTTAVVVFAGAGRRVAFAAADHVVTVEPPGFRP